MRLEIPYRRKLDRILANFCGMAENDDVDNEGIDFDLIPIKYIAFSTEYRRVHGLQPHSAFLIAHLLTSCVSMAKTLFVKVNNRAPHFGERLTTIYLSQ
jgi:hypothetical protein